MALSLVLTRDVRLLVIGSDHLGLVAMHRPTGAPRRWLRRSLGTALLVAAGLGSALLCLGVYQDGLYVGSRVDATTLQMGEVNKHVELYALKHGVPPGWDGLEVVYGSESAPSDAWGRRFLFVPTPQGLRGDWELVSFGRDGSLGGEGLDADLYWSEQ